MNNKYFKYIPLLLAFCSLLAFSQSVSPHKIKSAILFRILDQVSWGDKKKSDTIKIGILGPESEFSKSLLASRKDYRPQGKDLDIQVVGKSEKLVGFHVVVIPRGQAESLHTIARALRKTGTLLVSEESAESNEYMVNLFLTKDKKVRFNVNRINIVFEGLTIDKEVLLLGGSEIDVANIYKEAEFKLQKMKEKLFEAENKTKAQLRMALEEKENFDRELENLRNIVAQEKEKIKRDSDALEEIKNHLKEKNSELSLKEIQIIKFNKIIDENTSIIKGQESKIDTQEKTLFLSFAVVLIFFVLLIFIWRVNILRNREIKERVSIQKDLSDTVKLLDVARKKATEASKSKSNFLANMSHEIRTPMNAILGFSELLSRDKDLTNSQRTKIESINSGGEHLLSLINDVLEMSKIESGKIDLKLSEFNVRDFLRELEGIFNFRYSSVELERSFFCDKEVPAYVQADKGKIRQILVNLIANAIKFTPSGEVRVEVSARRGEIPENIILYFRVKDTGMGIAPESIEHIFGSFERGKEVQQHIQGTGLGLAISKSYAEFMGGSIDVTSELGKGSVFTFKCEVKIAEGVVGDFIPSEKRIVGISPEVEEMRVLIVDDNLSNRQVLSEMLNNVGFVTKHALDGRHCLEIYKKWHPQIICMDIVMPVMDGIETTEAIRKLPDGQEVSIIIVSASALEDGKNRVIERGADVYLRKPVREKEIFAAIKQCVNIEYIEELLLPRPESTGRQLSKNDLTVLPRELCQKIAEGLLAGNIALLGVIFEEIKKIDDEMGTILNNRLEELDFPYLKDLFDVHERPV